VTSPSCWKNITSIRNKFDQRIGEADLEVFIRGAGGEFRGLHGKPDKFHDPQHAQRPLSLSSPRFATSPSAACWLTARDDVFRSDLRYNNSTKPIPRERTDKLHQGWRVEFAQI